MGGQAAGSMQAAWVNVDAGWIMDPCWMTAFGGQYPPLQRRFQRPATIDGELKRCVRGKRPELGPVACGRVHLPACPQLPSRPAVKVQPGGTRRPLERNLRRRRSARTVPEPHFPPATWNLEVTHPPSDFTQGPGPRHSGQRRSGLQRNPTQRRADDAVAQQGPSPKASPWVMMPKTAALPASPVSRRLRCQHSVGWDGTAVVDRRDSPGRRRAHEVPALSPLAGAGMQSYTCGAMSTNRGRARLRLPDTSDAEQAGSGNIERHAPKDLPSPRVASKPVLWGAAQTMERAGAKKEELCTGADRQHTEWATNLHVSFPLDRGGLEVVDGGLANASVLPYRRSNVCGGMGKAGRRCFIDSTRRAGRIGGTSQVVCR
ncbi:hypothetical protein Purlil1_6181 [Purpureocillium lilacinum]|uniref:Uncharacterized protein n=1 Tax=Purpureocillium lilacinum TaxID=33203 RepID=A0ABR0C020_PURLI|nr:hypothetical protein Purlil1_6181 [Purpureocillium lilacinum]